MYMVMVLDVDQALVWCLLPMCEQIEEYGIGCGPNSNSNNTLTYEWIVGYTYVTDTNELPLHMNG